MATATAEPDLAAPQRRRLTGLVVCIAVLALVCVLSLAVGTESVGLFVVAAIALLGFHSLPRNANQI